MSGAEWDAYMSEITALLETQNGKIDTLNNAISYMASQQAATAQSQEVAYYLILGTLGIIIAGLGIIVGMKLIKILVERSGKWL